MHKIDFGVAASVSEWRDRLSLTLAATASRDASIP